MKYIVAKTFKKNGSVAISIDEIPSLMAYSELLDEKFKRKIEVLLLSGDTFEALEEAWPEYGPISLAANIADLEQKIEEKLKRKG